MKKTLLIWMLSIATLSAQAAWVKPSSTNLIQTVTVNGSGVIVSPSNFVAANGLGASVVDQGRTVTVSVTNSATSNGAALLAAYASAQALSPSVSSNVTIVLPPQTYALGTNTLNMTSEYINIVGQIPVKLTTPIVRGSALSGENPKATITASGLAITSTVAHAYVANVKIDGLVYTAGDKAQVWENVWFTEEVDLGSSTSNIFVGVYAAKGICVLQAFNFDIPVDAHNFYGTVEKSVVNGAHTLGVGATSGGYVIDSSVYADFAMGPTIPVSNSSMNIVNSTIDGAAKYAGGGMRVNTFSGKIVNSDIREFDALAFSGKAENSSFSAYDMFNNAIFTGEFSGCKVVGIDGFLNGSSIRGKILRCDFEYSALGNMTDVTFPTTSARKDFIDNVWGMSSLLTVGKTEASAITYTFVATLAQANDVKIGANDAASLTNLMKAINGNGTAGVNYYAGTVSNTEVRAVGITGGTHLTIEAKQSGVAGNVYYWSEGGMPQTLSGGTGAAILFSSGITPSVTNSTGVQVFNSADFYYKPIPNQ